MGKNGRRGANSIYQRGGVGVERSGGMEGRGEM